MKLNSRGSISAMVKPETGQANFSLNTMRLAGTPAPFIAPPSEEAGATPKPFVSSVVETPVFEPRFSTSLEPNGEVGP